MMPKFYRGRMLLYQSPTTYIIVGDNIDKNVTPRDMRVGNQVKSLHYFHSYAVQDQVKLGSLSGDGHVSDINNLFNVCIILTYVFVSP